MFDEPIVSDELNISDNSVENNINEYYRLKNKYDEQNQKNKKKILNNKLLSLKEKKAEFKQLKPKCVNCGKPGGTTFASVINKGNGVDSEFREIRAFCNAVNPCGLNINIAVGNYENLNDTIKWINKEMYESKKEIINDKNKILFGFLKMEDALDNFDLNKALIKDYSGLLEDYLQRYTKIADNSEKKEEIDMAIETVNLYIQQIKNAIKQYNTTDDVAYIDDVANLYVNNLQPKLKELMNLKYNEKMVWYNENTNTYHLIQRKNTIQDLEFNMGKFQTIMFDRSIKNTQLKPLKLKSSESSSSELVSESSIIGKPTINKDTGSVTWSNKNYQSVWNNMNNKLKSALLTDKEWLQEFMDNCVKARLTDKIKNGDEPLFIPSEQFGKYKKGYTFKQGKLGKGYYLEDKACEFMNPSNLIIPPQILEDGIYDFGNTVYNDIFNKFDETYKNTLLTLFSIDEDGFTKNYSLLENALADIVKKELGFGSGYF